MSHQKDSWKLFEGEKWLVITGLIGFMLAAGISIMIYFQGSIVLPEGNLRDAFSFNAAIGIFLLSIAAILPLARLKNRTRKFVRLSFIIASLYAYGIETIQNFRGLNPRFSREGSVIDIIAGALFGIDSLLLVALALSLTVQFFKIQPQFSRPLLITGIRYAFLSVLAANIAGLWMIFLQDRLIGETGNFIVLHGLGFHALQTLILSAWLLEKTQLSDRLNKLLLHIGSVAWMISILLIGIQTVLGRSVFELTAFPIFACIMLLLWLGTTVVASVYFMKNKAVQTEDISAYR